MMPFRYFLDNAYVVPALRKRELGLSMNRRKSTIVGLVLLAHGGFIWGLVNFIAPPPSPIEFVETQVILEQVTPKQQPAPTPIVPTPQVQQKVTDAPVSQPNPVLRVNENAEIKQAVKPAETQAAAVAPVAQAVAPATAQTAVAAQASKPAAPVLATKCDQVSGVKASGQGADVFSVKVRIKRSANGQIILINLLSSVEGVPASSIKRQAKAQLTFPYKSSECEGVEFETSLKINVPNL